MSELVMSSIDMVARESTQTELEMNAPELSVVRRRHFGGRERTELAFILLYPIFLPLPILNVVAGILSAYAILSLTARGRLVLALAASALALGISSLIHFSAMPSEFNTAMMVMTAAPIFALAIGFRVFSRMQSAFILMALVTIVTVSVVFMMSEEIIGGVFDELKELAVTDPTLSASMMSQLIESLRWLTPALIATQALLPVTLTWYLAPTLERVLSGGRTVELATSPHFRWLTMTQWRLPQFTLVTLFVFAAGRILADSMEIDATKRVFDNLLLVSGLLFSLTGFALVEYTFRRFRVAWFMRALFYFLALVSALPGTVFLAVVGLADTQFDLRRRMPSRTTDEIG